MSVLTREQIVERISSGNLYVGPILDDRQIGKVTVDLRLGTVVGIVRGNRLTHVDPRIRPNHGASPSQEEQSRRRKLEKTSAPFMEPLVLHVGTLTLATTYEWVKLPADLQGVVTARSSWAREGLSIATATFVDPGYTGTITLELGNFGEIPITIYPGMRVAQIAFYTTQPGEAPPSDLVATSQFDLSFEPRYGDLRRYDDAFIP